MYMVVGLTRTRTESKSFQLFLNVYSLTQITEKPLQNGAIVDGKYCHSAHNDRFILLKCIAM